MIAAEGIPEGLPPRRARKGRSERQGADDRQGSAAYSEALRWQKRQEMDCAWFGLETVEFFDAEISLAGKLAKKTWA